MNATNTSSASDTSRLPDAAAAVHMMQGAIGQLRFARQYTLELLEATPRDRWFEIPAGLSTNVAWQVGHLAVSQYGLLMFRIRGRQAEDLKLIPGKFRKAYARQSTPSADPTTQLSADALLDRMNEVFDLAMSELDGVAPDVLLEPVDMPYAAFPIKLGAILFCPLHEHIHAGQIGIVRRAWGYNLSASDTHRRWIIDAGLQSHLVTLTTAPYEIETVSESIYDHPKYYDLVFGSDCAAEAKFIVGCASKYMQREPTRMFEPACGTGRLLYALAKRGYEVRGLDLNAKAVEFCNTRFRRHGLMEPAFVANMSDFRVRRRYDIAFNTINSFRHLRTEATAKAHLQCMGKTVRVGGLYLLGVHLTPTEVAPSETESWSARRGHLSINTHMWTKERNRKRRVERFGIRFDIHRPTRSFRIVDELVLRSYTPAQMDRLIQTSECWEAVETFSFGYDLKDPIEVDAATEDVVYVLRRRRAR